MDGKTLRQTLAMNLSDLIAKSDKSQNQVAREAGLASSTLSSYMTGARYPRPAQLQTLAGVLNTTVSALIGEGSASVRTEPAWEDDVAQIARLCTALSPEDRKSVLDYAKYLRHRKK